VLWLTKQLSARIAEQNLFLLKVNKSFTKKRALKMSHKDVLNAEKQENNKETIEAIAIDINNNFCLIGKSGFKDPLLFIIKV
jgi:hypothetical protein